MTEGIVMDHISKKYLLSIGVSDEFAETYLMDQAGKKTKEIAAKINRSLTTVFSRVNTVNRLIERHNNKSMVWLRGLPTRAANMLLRNNMKCKNDVVDFIKGGGRLKSLDDCARSTERYILKFLDIENTPVEPKFVKKYIELIELYGYTVTKNA